MSATVIVLQGSEDDSDRCKEELSGSFDVVMSTSDYAMGLAEIERVKPDFVITPLVLPSANVDGICVVKRVKELSEKTKCVVTERVKSSELISLILRTGASLFVEKPIDFVSLKESLSKRNEGRPIRGKVIYAADSDKGTEKDRDNDLAKENANFENEKELDLVIGRLFVGLGISPHIKGFNYLRSAIIMLIKEPRLIESVTKGLYPRIGKKYDTSASKVERAIRHAIEVAWNRGKTSAFNEMLGVEAFSPNEKPTNSEFMALIADRLMLQNYILY